MYGTASAGSSWMLLELCGGWGHSAFLQSPAIIDPELGRAIVRRVETAGMRIAAIRRHGRRPATPRWRWFVAQSGVGSEALYYGEVSDPRDYLDLALDGSDGASSTDPLVAVCAHGKHDQCCAVRGRSATAGDRGEVPRIHLGMLSFGRRSLRGDDARAAGRAVLRAGRLDRFGGPGPSVSRRSTGQQVSPRTHLATACRAGRAIFRARANPATTASRACHRSMSTHERWHEFA